MARDATTEKNAALLEKHGYDGRAFEAVGFAEERPSILWTLLSPWVFRMMTTCYLAGYDPSRRSLVLHQVKSGFFSRVGGISNVVELDADKLSDVRFSGGLFSATLSFVVR